MAGRTQDLVDNFDTNTINTSKWVNGSFTSGTAAQSNGVLVCTPAVSTLNTGGELDSVLAYDLTGSYALVRVLQVASQNCETIFLLQLDGSNRVYFDQKAGTLSAFSVATTGGFVTIATIAYSATTMAWWKIRESGGTIFWDYSADGTIWTNLGSETARIAVTGLKAQLAIFDGTSDAAPGSAIFDNFNLPPHNYAFSRNYLRPRPFAPGVAR